MKTIKFRKCGRADWQTLRGPLTLSEFNEYYGDWVANFYEGTDQTACRSWDDAADVLATVGRSAWSGDFEICEPEY